MNGSTFGKLLIERIEATQLVEFVKIKRIQ